MHPTHSISVMRRARGGRLTQILRLALWREVAGAPLSRRFQYIGLAAYGDAATYDHKAAEGFNPRPHRRITSTLDHAPLETEARETSGVGAV